MIGAADQKSNLTLAADLQILHKNEKFLFT